MCSEPLPGYLEEIVDRLIACSVFADGTRPNHVLINEYQPGQGIMPHKDGPLYLPRVAIVSTGGTVVMQLTPPKIDVLDDAEPQSQCNPLQIILKPGSLLVFEHDVYEQWMHGISETTESVIEENTINCHLVGQHVGDLIRRDRRVSLTIRRVLKVV